MRVVVVDLSGHIEPDVGKVKFQGAEVAAIIQPEIAGMTINFERFEEDITKFRVGAEEALQRAFRMAEELGTDAVALIPHGASFLAAATNIVGVPVRGTELVIAAFDVDERMYVLTPLRSVRARP